MPPFPHPVRVRALTHYFTIILCGSTLCYHCVELACVLGTSADHTQRTFTHRRPSCLNLWSSSFNMHWFQAPTMCCVRSCMKCAFAKGFTFSFWTNDASGSKFETAWFVLCCCNYNFVNLFDASDLRVGRGLVRVKLFTSEQFQCLQLCLS